MRIATLLRTQPSLWAALPLVVFTALYTTSYFAFPPEPYAVAITSGTSVTLAFVAPVCAALGAWEAGRLRRAAWWGLPHVRPNLLIAGVALLPTILVGVFAVGAGTALQLVRAQVALPDSRIIVVVVMVIGSHSLAGFALGTRWPVVIAAPTIMLGSFLWMALPRAMEPLWIRHLTGSLESCCLLQHDLAPEATLASIAVAAGVAAASLLLISEGWRVATILTAAIITGTGLLSGAGLVMDLGADPVKPRDPTNLVCTSAADLEICVWPEHSARLTEVADVATGAAAGWNGVGVVVPRAFTEADESLVNQGEASYGFGPESSDRDLLFSLAYALLPPFPICADQQPYPGASVRDSAHAWLLASAGTPDVELEARFPSLEAPGIPSVLDVVSELQSASREDQIDWMRVNVDAMARCGVEPRLHP